MVDLDEACQLPAQECACHALRSLSRRVTRHYERHLSEFGMTAGQFTILVIMHLRGPLSLSEVGRLTGSDRTTLYRAVKPLREHGWILESEDKADRRVRAVQLSSRGRKVLQSALPAWKDAHLEFVEEMGVSRWALLLPDLQRMSEGVDQLLARGAG